jgi:uncharacterized membrane protein
MTVPPRVDRWLRVAVGVWAALAVVAMLAMWPGDRSADNELFGNEVRVNGDVRSVEIRPCTGTDAEAGINCRFTDVLLTSGAQAGTSTMLELGVADNDVRVPEVGDEIILSEQLSELDGSYIYSFADYQRGGSMTLLLLLFVAAVLLLGRWRGLGAIGGLALSVVVLVVFMIPALLDGSSPVVVSIVAASIIAVASLYLAHGFATATHVALLSTLTALLLTGLLSWLFVGLTGLTGFTDESSFFLDALGVQIDPRGLVLAGFVIGALGVLDDVTVTQVSAVSVLREARPDTTARELYWSALSVGRDHISSTVNTLFLAYAGAALPLLLLFSETGQGVLSVATREQVAVEIVRTLVGSIGLVAAVPISTGLAVWALVSRAGDGGGASASAGWPRTRRRT